MNTTRLLLVLFGACTLAGCPQRASRTSDVAVTPAPADAPASTEAIPTETSFIHGRATYPERIKMAPGADPACWATWVPRRRAHTCAWSWNAARAAMA